MVPGDSALASSRISELVDPGGAILDQPELHGDRLPVLARDAEPQRPRRAFLLGQRAQEGGEPSSGFQLAA